MCAHSAAVTGCTERRKLVIRLIAARALSSLASARVKGRGRGALAARSTHWNLPVASVGSAALQRHRRRL